MADPILHIKDTYYFELPKFFWRSGYTGIKDDGGASPFPDFWIRLDGDYQKWQAEQLVEAIASLPEPKRDPEAHGDKPLAPRPDLHDVVHDYEHWKHEGHHHENVGKPFQRFLAEHPDQTWFQQRASDAQWRKSFDEAVGKLDLTVDRYQQAASEWSDQKVKAYNKQLDGKIIIPQPFGELNNLYQPSSGFCISKFMVIELVVAAIIVFVFVRLAGRIRGGGPPKGKLWNLLESFLVFLRDEVARPAIGHDADKFMPLIWTIFFFVLGMNLFGMLPWAGAPTGAFAVTGGMALVTFATVLVCGSKKFGIVGFWKNQVPSMGLPLVLAIFIVPMIFAIEVLGLFIKHGVLAVRLLANMVAGHLVLLGIMYMAFSLKGALSDYWAITAVISVVAATLFSLLELFVAFLQAYIFAFLSSLFIGAATHQH